MDGECHEVCASCRDHLIAIATALDERKVSVGVCTACHCETETPLVMRFDDGVAPFTYRFCAECSTEMAREMIVGHYLSETDHKQYEQLRRKAGLNL